MRDGHVDEAISCSASALKSDPDNGVAHYHLGLALTSKATLARGNRVARTRFA